jgi:hypothetical protein
MNTHNEQMKSINHFWIIYKSECLNIRSIDDVYNKYTDYHKSYADAIGTKYSVIPLNKYKFRSLIRKRGYNNSKK